MTSRSQPVTEHASSEAATAGAEPSAAITRELVRDPVELIFSDGRRYATQRWITTTNDVRDIGGGVRVNFGSVHIGAPFPTSDSVSSPLYKPPPAPGVWARMIGAMRRLQGGRESLSQDGAPGPDLGPGRTPNQTHDLYPRGK